MKRSLQDQFTLKIDRGVPLPDKNVHPRASPERQLLDKMERGDSTLMPQEWDQKKTANLAFSASRNGKKFCYRAWGSSFRIWRTK